MRETSTDYRRPHRPAAVRLANRVLPRGRAMTVQGLQRAASKRTGLTDFGPSDYEEPLAVLLDSIEAEARLHPVGRLITEERLVGVLANRLRSTAAIDAEVEAIELPQPIVITGLQRTGTTLLHRLLSSDPRHRFLASWEALNPAPLKRGHATWRAEPRISAAETAETALRYLAPDFFAVHPVQAHGPEEDVLLLDQSMRSTVPEATLRVPTFASWIEEQDQKPAYTMLRRLMQLLSSQRGRGKRWVLKTPHHLEWLDDLFCALPDARVIWTHRDPVTTVASFCSMVAHGRGVFSDEVDPHEVGQGWGRKTARMVDRALEARASREHAFFDVPYARLTADPIAEVGRIYDALGIELTAAAERKMRETLEHHGQHRFGKHRYELEDFGLRREALEERFGAYRERFVAG